MFGLKTVDGVLDALVKAHEQLGDVVTQQADRSDKLAAEAFELLNEATFASRESVRATKVRERLAALLGFEEPEQSDPDDAGVGEPGHDEVS